jgi:ABC-2 type transport system permease protein
VLSTYASLVRSSSLAVLAYRGRLLVGFLTDFFPFLLLAVWLTVVAGGGAPRGWSAGDFIAYYAAAAVLWHLSAQHVIWQWDADLRSGDLSVRLLRPLHPFHQYAADDLGHRAISLVVLVPALVIAAVVLPALNYDLTGPRALLGVGATMLAYVVGLLMAALVGLLGFWSTQTVNIWMLWWGLGSFTSGWVAPIELMPAWIRVVAIWLPFRSTMGFPVEVWTGRLSGAETSLGFAVAFGWAVVLAGLYVALWRRGLRRYQAVAG